ncbi:MAG TPA: hypothetical protein VIL26_03485 [Clostridia bacterium]
MEIIFNFLYQIVFSIAVLVVFGLFLAYCRKSFCRILGSRGVLILLITGFVGVPIHELSHAFMCLIFGHKIVGIKLYQPLSVDGSLGYVRHTYNRKNFYQQIGNFFIATAPIVLGSAFLLLLMLLFVPHVFFEVIAKLDFSNFLSTNLFESSTYVVYLEKFRDIVWIIFDSSNIYNFLWWIYIVLALMIASHMELSTADCRSAIKGFFYVACGLLIADIIMFFVSKSALKTLLLQ